MNENEQKTRQLAANMFIDGWLTKEQYEEHLERMEKIDRFEAIGLIIANLVLVVGMIGVGLIWFFDVG